MGNTLTEKCNEVWDATIDPETEEEVTTYLYRLSIKKDGSFTYENVASKANDGFYKSTTTYKGTYELKNNQILALSTTKDVELEVTANASNVAPEQTETLDVPDNTSFVWSIQQDTWALVPQGFQGQTLERRPFSFQL